LEEGFMKKIVLLLLLGIMLTSCSAEGTEVVDTLSGKYYFDECVYLTFLSSSTKEYFAEQHSGEVYILFDETSIEYHGTEQTTLQYDQVNFKNIPVTENFDDVLNLDIDDVFSNFDQRFDIYDGNSYIGLTLFVNEDSIYLAEIRILGENPEEYFIWAIFSLSGPESGM
jgi:hypothetical protein